MSERDSTSESGGGHHNIVLTPEEKKVFGQLFQAADSENIGVVTGELAVKFFEKSGLNPRILGEIWGIADTENRGLLTKVGFSVALRLIGQAQNGQHPRPELAQNPGPLPRFDGVNITYPPPPPTASPPPAAVPAQMSGPAGMIRVPPLTPQDCEKFTGLFEKSGAVNGILPGDIAKGIFQRAKLPNQTLGLIWSLADRQHRGALGVQEFVVAMHLITCSKNGSLPVLPQILPPGLYEAASGRPSTRNGPDRRLPGGRGMPPSMPPVPPIPKQCSGPVQRAQSPLSRQFTPPITQAVERQPSGSEWAISAADKARFDAVFLTVDRQNRGFITGEEAVPFFGNSNLPEDMLASIWDLADISKSGRLNRDEFAIAMHLICQQRNAPDGRGLPEVLPPNLIPPSMRKQRPITATSAGPPSQPTNAFEPTPPPPPPPPKSAADDLFGLDSFTSSSSAPVTASHTGGQTSLSPYETDLFGNTTKASSGNSGPNSPLQTGQTGPSSFFNTSQRMFVPSSSFGQSIVTSSTTGGSTHSAPGGRPQQQQQQQQQKSEMDDLLGDNDPEVSKKLTSDTTELANLSNQIGSLTKQTQEMKGKRSSADQELNTLASQKHNIEVQLAQLRSAYEREAAHVKQVEQQLANSRAETAKLRQEYTIVEATYNEMQARRQEIASALESDRRENENLNSRMKVINSENLNLRQELERLQSQSRQQRGMVAINKKQVANGEMEREKYNNQIEEARSNMASPPPASPTLSQASVNTNPFYRRSPSAAPDSAFSPSPFAPGPAPSQSPFTTGNSAAGQSPFAQANPASSSPFGQGDSTRSQQSLDDVFGPAFTSPSPAPPSAFPNKAHTETSVASGPTASEGGGIGDSTPPTSPPTSSYHNSPRTDVPPPSTASQMTSAFLPLHVNRADSSTSSVQVNPPASVQGDPELPRPETPTHWMGSVPAETPARERDAFVSAHDRRTSFSVKSDAGTESSMKVSFKNDKSPFGSVAPVERNTTGTTTGGDEDRFGAKTPEKRDSFQGFGPAPSVSIPGAFPGEGMPSPIKPTPTGESNKSNKSRASNISKSGFGDSFSQNRSDPFGLKDDARSTTSKSDFDDAFKTFGIPGRNQERQHTGGSGTMNASRFDKEFPPIEEINQDEDSDSASEKGFDDNFTSSSPVQHHAQLPKSATTSDSTPSGGPPPLAAQQSPPSYNQSTGSGENNPYPAEFTGLLPSRTDPLKHEGSTPGGNTNTIVFPSAPSPAVTPAFGPGPSRSPPPQTQGSSLFSSSPSALKSPPATSKSPAPIGSAPPNKVAVSDEFDDDEFGDLAEAKEADDKGDENDFGTSSDFDSFQPVFDSPSTAASKPRNISSEDDFANFNFNIDTPSQQQQHPGLQDSPVIQSNQPQGTSSSEDWDAIFGGFSSGPTVNNNNQESNGSGLSPRAQANGNVSSSGASGSASGITPAEGKPGLPRRQSGTDPVEVEGGVALPKTGDDENVTKLTGMGFDRESSVKALEKHGYNLDKAANSLLPDAL